MLRFRLLFLCLRRSLHRIVRNFDRVRSIVAVDMGLSILELVVDKRVFVEVVVVVAGLEGMLKGIGSLGFVVGVVLLLLVRVVEMIVVRLVDPLLRLAFVLVQLHVFENKGYLGFVEKRRGCFYSRFLLRLLYLSVRGRR